MLVAIETTLVCVCFSCTFQLDNICGCVIIMLLIIDNNNNYNNNIMITHTKY